MLSRRREGRRDAAPDAIDFSPATEAMPRGMVLYRLALRGGAAAARIFFVKALSRKFFKHKQEKFGGPLGRGWTQQQDVLVEE